MNRKYFSRVIISGGLISLASLLFIVQMTPVEASGFPRQLTVIIPTVTGTPIGAAVTVKSDQEQINVRSGPGTLYPKVGVLLAGQVIPAKGKSPGGEWILVEYPGVEGGTAWLYAPLVDLVPGSVLEIVEPPPTPTPLSTATIDPTLAAQFIVTTVPTRLPTFTPPPPLQIPTFQAADAGGMNTKIPPGMVIISLLTIGALLGVVSFTQGR
jgi:uncharacterized protein YraI